MEIPVSLNQRDGACDDPETDEEHRYFPPVEFLREKISSKEQEELVEKESQLEHEQNIFNSERPSNEHRQVAHEREIIDLEKIGWHSILTVGQPADKIMVQKELVVISVISCSDQRGIVGEPPNAVAQKRDVDDEEDESKEQEFSVQFHRIKWPQVSINEDLHL